MFSRFFIVGKQIYATIIHYNGKTLKGVIEEIITSTTKKRLEKLEEQRDDLALKIHTEQCNLNNQIKREDVITYLSEVIKHRPQLLIHSSVRRVVLQEEKAEISYNYSEYPPPSDNKPEEESEYYYDFCSNKIFPSPPIAT